MPNSQKITQTQRLEQRQQLSAQQILVAKLTELSVEELRARIETECEENPWLERTSSDSYDDEGGGLVNDSGSEGDADTDENFDENDGLGNSSDNSDEADWGSDEFPSTYADDHSRQREDGELLSFHELLMQQVGEYDLDEHKRYILEYLIGSLDDDGFLHTPLYEIADELDIYHNVRTHERELESILKVLQEFEPAGVGARNLCECLLIQVRRNESLPMRSHLITLFEHYADEFTQTHWDVIQRKMKLSDADLTALRRAIKRLNPRPGGSIGRLPEEAAHIVVPDFKVQTNEYGDVFFQLCESGIPQLQMSEDPSQWMSEYTDIDEKSISKEVRDALRYQRKQIETGSLFIEALAQRRRSLTAVMRAIIKLQGDFFREGDETLLRPMRMEDVAQLSGLDISTVSRVCRSKSVDTSYGTFPLRWFFSSGTKKEGEEFSVRHILSALKKLVDEEDKRHPLSDEDLTDILQKQGYDVARRTVAKYREQLGIPNSRMRK